MCLPVTRTAAAVQVCLLGDTSVHSVAANTQSCPSSAKCAVGLVNWSHYIFISPKEFCVYNRITSSDSCLCGMLSQRFDSGIGPPSGPILPPPVPSASLHRNGSGRDSRRKVTQFVFVTRCVQNTTICSKGQTPGRGHILATLAFVCLFFRKNYVINLCSRKLSFSCGFRFCQACQRRLKDKSVSTAVEWLLENAITFQR